MIGLLLSNDRRGEISLFYQGASEEITVHLKLFASKHNLAWQEAGQRNKSWFSTIGDFLQFDGFPSALNRRIPCVHNPRTWKFIGLTKTKNADNAKETFISQIHDQVDCTLGIINFNMNIFEHKGKVLKK